MVTRKWERRVCVAGWLALGATGAAAGQAAAPAAAAEVRHGYVLADGTVQMVTSAALAGTVRALDQLYLERHAGVRFTLRSGDNYSAMATLTFDRTPVAPLGCEYTRIGLGDNLKVAGEPLGIRIGHATMKPGPGVPMLGVVVHQGNPLAALTMEQLTRIFAVGAPGGDIATWGQAGVEGQLASRAIHVYGPMPSDEGDSEDPQAGEFLSVQMFGGLGMNHSYTGLARYAEVVERVREDPAAIGIVALNQPLTGVRVVALRSARGRPASTGTAEEIAAGRYPLDRYVYLYLRRDKVAPADPLSEEYVRIALSPAGQQAVASSGDGYAPLSPGEVAQEEARLAR